MPAVVIAGVDQHGVQDIRGRRVLRLLQERVQIDLLVELEAINELDRLMYDWPSDIIEMVLSGLVVFILA